MKMTEPDPELLRRATDGDLAAMDGLLAAIQPGVFNLAVRMLGQRDDAADATQEILLKVVTHLGSFRGQSSFTTWVWRVARNHLLNALGRSAASPEVSLEAIAERLQAGLEFAAGAALAHGEPGPMTPEDKLEARQLALGCTQRMLMTLGPEQRLVYVLDTVFALPSDQAAAVVGISPAAYRQRLSRARAQLDGFADAHCGLANAAAACRCERQLPAVRHQRQAGGPRPLPPLVAVHRSELAEAEQAFAAFTRVGDAAALFRAHPEYRAPESLRAAIRAVLTQEGFLPGRPLQ